MQYAPFHPPFHLKHAYVQTILASLKIRTWGKTPYLRQEKEMILETDTGTRLQGYDTPQPKTAEKGLVILLHGWEGSAYSTYIVTCGNYLYHHGYHVFRLNFRDHGKSHHLNKGLFYATLLDEVFQGVKQASALSGGAPIFLVGFSLGGNFAIRIASRYTEDAANPLSQVMSISPVLNPDKATDKIDGNPLILEYFLKKWRRSLALKQKLFPDRYDFTDILGMKTLRSMTTSLLEHYSDYAGAKEYFHSYAIHPEDTKDIRLPLTILASMDDPIIPVEDFYGLKLSGTTDLIVHAYGGHNGFLEGIFRPAWYDRFLREIFEVQCQPFVK